MAWVDIPLTAKLFQNVDETALTRAHAAIENGFITEAGGFSRFPGLEEFVALPGQGRIYVKRWRDSLYAVTQAGRMLALDDNGVATDKTEVAIDGGGRPIFATTDDYLVTAAGGKIVAFDDKKTFLLSPDAPEATHVAHIDGYILANEKGTGRFKYSSPGDPTKWDPLDTFFAAGSSDPVTAIYITPYREILVGGPDSVEQYERLQSGDPPFYRRFSVGEGIAHRYTWAFGDNAMWGVDPDEEVVRMSGQITQAASDDIGMSLEKIDDWTDAWAERLKIKGQKYIVLSIPNTTNIYGGKGLTLLFDYRQQRWTTLWGWDDSEGHPAHYPVWSFAKLGKITYAGGVDRIYRFTTSSHRVVGRTARMLLRTAPLSQLGEIRVDNVQFRVKRGVGSYTNEPIIRIRANRDNRGFGPWIHKSLGKSGQRDLFIKTGGFGCGGAFQFEIEVTDDCEVEISNLKADVTSLPR